MKPVFSQSELFREACLRQLDFFLMSGKERHMFHVRRSIEYAFILLAAVLGVLVPGAIASTAFFRQSR